MSRPKGYATQDARAAFLKDLEHKMLDIGIRSKKELAERMGKAPRTVYRRFEDVTQMDISDLQSLKAMLCPNPLLLLQAIGYSKKEIFLAVEEERLKMEAKKNV